MAPPGRKLTNATADAIPTPQPAAQTETLAATVEAVAPVAPEPAPPVDVEKLEREKIEARISSLPFPLHLLRWGLGDLGNAPGASFVYRRLALPMSGISSIDGVRSYPHLTSLEVPGNFISGTLLVLL